MGRFIERSIVASRWVMLSGYVNVVGSMDGEREAPGWIGKVDSGTLKVKLTVAIMAISSIQLLEMFLVVEHYTNDKILWLTVLHITSFASACLLAMLDRKDGTTGQRA